MTSDVKSSLSIVPNRPISSLYEVACLYVACDTYETSQSDDVPELPAGSIDETLRFLTPNEVSDLEGKSNSLISARIDLSGNEPTLADEAVVIEDYTHKDRFNVGYMALEKKQGSATDYSVSNYSGSNKKDVETLAHDTWGNRFLRGRFERWPQTEVAENVAKNHPDGEIIEALQVIGNDGDSMKRLEKELLSKSSFDDTKALVSIKIKLTPDGEYLYPGEIDVLNQVAIQSRKNKLADGFSTEEAYGNGIGFITGDNARVMGGTSGLQGQYSKGQQESFPDVDANESWRSRPLTAETAVTVANFDGIMDSFRVTEDGVSMYFLPYPKQTVTPEVFNFFYENIYKELKQSDDHFPRKLIEQTNIEEHRPDQYPMDIYTLFVVKADDPYTAYVDEPNMSVESIQKLDQAEVNVQNELEKTQLFGDIVENSGVFNNRTVAYGLLFGSHFDLLTAKTPDPEDPAESNANTTTDDPRFSRYRDLITGRKISQDSLIDEYVNQLIQIQRSQLGDKNDTRSLSLSTAVLAQYVRIQSLAAVELLDKGNLSFEGIINYAGVMKAESTTKEDDHDSRDERLKEYIASHDVINGSEERAVFLLGALVGRLTSYQYKNNVSHKVAEQHPIESVTRRNIHHITQNVLNKNNKYADMEGYGGMNKRYTSRLADNMLQKNPRDWQLTDTDMKWLYGLGLAYGRQDVSLSTDEQEQKETDN